MSIYTEEAERRARHYARMERVKTPEDWAEAWAETEKEFNSWMDKKSKPAIVAECWTCGANEIIETRTDPSILGGLCRAEDKTRRATDNPTRFTLHVTRGDLKRYLGHDARPVSQSFHDACTEHIRAWREEK